MAEKLIEFMDGDLATRIDIEDIGKGQRRLHIHKTQDVAPLLGNNADLRNATFKHRSCEIVDEQPFADIPMSVVLEWIQKHRFNILASPAQNGLTKEEQKAKLRKLLNSPDYAYLKTYNGRL